MCVCVVCKCVVRFVVVVRTLRCVFFVLCVLFVLCAGRVWFVFVAGYVLCGVDVFVCVVFCVTSVGVCV